MTKLKPLAQQVIIITGASSGIGLTTALRAAEQGAKVVVSDIDGDKAKQASRDLFKADSSVKSL